MGYEQTTRVRCDATGCRRTAVAANPDGWPPGWVKADWGRAGSHGWRDQREVVLCPKHAGRAEAMWEEDPWSKRSWACR